MTPAARAAAAIQVLDAVLAAPPGGRRAERALADWGRASRFAGSGDRRAVRDLVYQALRRRRSAAWVGGSPGGRGLVLGLARLSGEDERALFDGSRHGPAQPGPDEAGRPLEAAPEAVRLDCPDWLLEPLRRALGPQLTPFLQAGQARGPLFLRAALRRGGDGRDSGNGGGGAGRGGERDSGHGRDGDVGSGRAAALAALAAEGIAARPHPAVSTALEVVEGAARLGGSRAVAEGRVEPMDAHSQAAVLALGEVSGLRVLDYCAGAGGKALMLADLGAEVTAHDAAPQRMAELSRRATRAGLPVALAAPSDLAAARRWPLVLADAPCSGSGTWRRDPEGKWALTPARLAELTATQDAILNACARLVAPGGRLAFVTCSALDEEGPQRAAAFLARSPGWCGLDARRLPLGAAGDGFQIAIFGRSGE